MPAKGSGEGSIFFRKDRKKWNAQYTEYDVMKDKYVTKNKIFAERKDAEKFLQMLNYRKENPIYIKKNGIPLYDLMVANLDNKKKANLISEAQYDRILRSLGVIKKAPFIYRNIEDIKAEEVQAFLNEMSKTYSNSSIKKFKEQFGQAFKYAFNKGYIDKNPMIEVVRPKSQKPDKDIRAMTIEEESKLLDYLTHHSIDEVYYKNAYLMQLFMGFRIGEVLALDKGDIDLAHHLVNIHKTLTKGVNGVPEISNSPKTKAGNRILPIPKFLLPYIVEQIQFSKDIPGNQEEHLLFKPPIVHYARESSLNCQLKTILKKLGLPSFSTHQLRHTYATRCIESGMSPVVLQKLMGHTDVSVTLNAYTSVFDKYKKDEVEKVNDYYMETNLVDTSTTPLGLDDGLENLIESSSKEVDSNNNEVKNDKNNEVKENDDEFER